ncbi:TonB-dependent receptor [Flavobacteriales bacterium]|nr:TonB-dependent receptor [Flavobacteriales bacterium]
MKRISVFLVGVLLCFESIAQTTISGKITDANTGEPLIGATIIYGKGLGTATDFDGHYSIFLHPGERSLQVSYVGYKEAVKIVTIGVKEQTLDFKLKTILLNEVQVVADIAIDRETPVAFSTIPMKKISEELASQDIPMVLNSTPGVYATQSGGGDGDARITIRGFNQRNVAVMIDGIPVNDMENGWVYWSNWFGLDAVTSNIQVQRGLGASKIAIPSVGGTMNILTKGTGSKAGGIVKQEVGSFGKLRTSLGYNSGKLENGWGYTLAGSYKKGNGFVEETWSEGFFYYAKIQKELGNHILSLSAMGAPQKHGQRSYKSSIATYDTTFARSLGDTSDFSLKDVVNKGIQYNEYWGHLDRWTLDNNGDTIHNRETLNTRQNYYHKPQFSLRDFWTVNDKFYVSNILYASIGYGGGTRSEGIGEKNGQQDLQETYNSNVGAGTFGPIILPEFSDTEYYSGGYLKSAVNNHYWYGGLSTLNYQATENLSLSGGVDMRYYKGEHYNEVYDLLGGDYTTYGDDIFQINDSKVKRIGDIVDRHYDGIVKWSGVFSQAEYSNGMLSAFLNISGSNSAYKRIDYFRKKDLVLDEITFKEALGTKYILGEGYVPDTTIIYNGVSYDVNSKEAEYASTDWKWIRGHTIKTGANLNLDAYNNIFFNTGYISKAPIFSNIYTKSNTLQEYILNEKVKAIEGGYSYRSSLFSANVNSYYTIWENKPAYINETIGGVRYSDVVPMNALHKGLEIDLSCKFNQKLSVEGLLSLGDWTWTSGGEAVILDSDNHAPSVELGDTNLDTLNYDANGVHVGDAAQTQYGLSMRYEPNDNTYIKLRGTYFANYYSDFDAGTLKGENSGRESWGIPAYQIFDLHTGYKFKLSDKNKLDVRLSILNLLDEMYISDATNNDEYSSNNTDFDAKSASVFFGLGRRLNLSVKFSF